MFTLKLEDGTVKSLSRYTLVDLSLSFPLDYQFQNSCSCAYILSSNDVNVTTCLQSRGYYFEGRVNFRKVAFISFHLISWLLCKSTNSVRNLSDTASTSASKGGINMWKYVLCFLKSQSLDLNSSVRTPTSSAYFVTLKDTHLPESFKIWVISFKLHSLRTEILSELINHIGFLFNWMMQFSAHETTWKT
jgi:hypothetical protein